jgi:hypothetical protein
MSPPERAAVGFSVHTGWAVAVSLAGPPETPRVVDRRRLDLTDPAVSRQVYHAARELKGSRAEQLVRRGVEAADAAARRELGSLLERLRAEGHEPVAAGLPAPRETPRTVAETLASHVAMHAAEGELYREALARASGRLGLRVEEAERGLQAAPDVTALGGGLGPPWGRDQKMAAAHAWLALRR